MKKPTGTIADGVLFDWEQIELIGEQQPKGGVKENSENTKGTSSTAFGGSGDPAPEPRRNKTSLSRIRDVIEKKKQREEGKKREISILQSDTLKTYLWGAFERAQRKGRKRKEERGQR